jgi:hypothetical protein
VNTAEKKYLVVFRALFSKSLDAIPQLLRPLFESLLPKTPVMVLQEIFLLHSVTGSALKK